MVLSSSMVITAAFAPILAVPGFLPAKRVSSTLDALAPPAFGL